MTSERRGAPGGARTAAATELDPTPRGHLASPAPARPATSVPCREARRRRDPPPVPRARHRPRSAPTWARPNPGAAGGRVTGCHCYANIKTVKGAPAREASESCGAWEGAWEPRGSRSRTKQAPGPRDVAVPGRARPPRAERAPPSPPGRGWMRQGPRGGDPRPRAPGAPRGGVRGPGTPRPPCAEARPEPAGGPRRSRRPR
ncbi:hypothetical protein P7K49_002204 [Saguinus oedipus]|uniref:Uncharacterized protein n=1 Tax=Saguinus oedipus TaxID=9490 RepID=A0ABQ9WJB4_SAGOE|nr:hypothetical protein P7K49_002204 [Saguinus oedipus]